MAMRTQRRPTNYFYLGQFTVIFEHFEMYVIEQMVQSIDTYSDISDLFIHFGIDVVFIFQIITRLGQLVDSHT